MPPSFADLGVPQPIVDALAQARIREPFPIQAETIPDLLAGHDVVGRAPTGSGKTLAFGVPLIALLDKAQPKAPKALILAPTRELAAQITDELRPLASAYGRKVLAVYGGVGIQPQINKLRQGIDLLVATPGRLEDLISQRCVRLSEVNIVVVDEADRMADMGFLPVVRRLLDQTASDRQTILYSATLDGDVGKVIAQYQSNPRRHEVGSATPDLTAMQHHFWEIPRNERIPLCASVIATFGRTIVFTRTRHGADRAAKQLARLGVKGVPIHGNRSQGQRKRALEDFAKGRAHALVATDVAARGIHVDAVECVVHFDPVDEDSAYIHRSGRTARAGAHGHVVSFVDPGQVKLVKAMKRRLDLPQEITRPPDVDGELPELDAIPAEPDNRQRRDDRPRRDNRNQGGGQRRNNNSRNNNGGQRRDNRDRDDSRNRDDRDGRDRRDDRTGDERDDRPSRRPTEKRPASRSGKPNPNRARGAKKQGGKPGAKKKHGGPKGGAKPHSGGAGKQGGPKGQGGAKKRGAKKQGARPQGSRGQGRPQGSRNQRPR